VRPFHATAYKDWELERESDNLSLDIAMSDKYYRLSGLNATLPKSMRSNRTGIFQNLFAVEQEDGSDRSF